MFIETAAIPTALAPLGAACDATSRLNISLLTELGVGFVLTRSINIWLLTEPGELLLRGPLPRSHEL